MNVLPAWAQEFAKLANLVSQYKFTSPLTEAQLAIADRLQAGSGGRPKNVYLVGSRWAVKYYCAGIQRVWGTFPAHDYVSAYRLADVLILRLFSRRVKSTQPLSDDSFNVTFGRAQQDNVDEGGLVALLIQMEALLPDKPERPSQAGKPKLNALARFEKFESTVLEALTEMQRRLDDSTKQLRDEIAQLRLHSQLMPTPSTLTPVIIQPPYIGDPLPNYPGDAPIVTCGGIFTANKKEETGCVSRVEHDTVKPQ